MTTAYTTPEALSDEYKRTGQRYIRQADAEFEKGDFLQASEKAWGAASEYVKSLASLRGLPHESHREIRIAVNHIVSETGWRQIRPLFAVAEGMHANFYEAWMPEEEIGDGIESVKELLALLESVPPSNGDTSIRPPRARLFIRDRGDDI